MVSNVGSRAGHVWHVLSVWSRRAGHKHRYEFPQQSFNISTKLPIYVYVYMILADIISPFLAQGRTNSCLSRWARPSSPVFRHDPTPPIPQATCSRTRSINILPATPYETRAGSDQIWRTWSGARKVVPRKGMALKTEEGRQESKSNVQVDTILNHCDVLSTYPNCHLSSTTESAINMLNHILVPRPLNQGGKSYLLASFFQILQTVIFSRSNMYEPERRLGRRRSFISCPWAGILPVFYVYSSPSICDTNTPSLLSRHIRHPRTSTNPFELVNMTPLIYPLPPPLPSSSNHDHEMKQSSRTAIVLRSSLTEGKLRCLVLRYLFTEKLGSRCILRGNE